RPARRPLARVTIPADQSVVVKVHGAVDRADQDGDSYVITENHYIDYLAKAHPSALLPKPVVARMTSSHLLFLGYAIRDWNVRVLLRYIDLHQRRTYPSWAIQRRPDEIDVKFWQQHNVDTIDMSLGDWVVAMRKYL